MPSSRTTTQGRSPHRLPLFLALGALSLALLIELVQPAPTRDAAPVLDLDDGPRDTAPTAPRPPANTAFEPPASDEATAVAPPSPRAPLAAPLASATTRRLLDSDDLRQRFIGLQRLAKEDPQRAVGEILAFIHAAESEERALLQRLAAVALLAELEGVHTGVELTTLYEAGDESLRRAAACALLRQGDATLVRRELNELAPALADPDGAIRARAVESVARLASSDGVPLLLSMLADPNSEVRAQAVDGLWLADDPTVIPEIEALANDPVERVRERVQRALSALRREGADGR